MKPLAGRLWGIGVKQGFFAADTLHWVSEEKPACLASSSYFYREVGEGLNQKM
jgi:SAM-dependent MidA family methyltransferase